MKLQFIRKYFGAYEWKKFTKEVRPEGGLLSALKNFPDSVLVTGCQRSGTTLVTRLLVQSDEINDIWVSNDDEYDAAMILSGKNKVKFQGRYCFQTTYLNDAYKEYIEKKDLPFKIIWVVRNPFSVVNSMIYNWKQFALNDTYSQCGKKYFIQSDRNSGLIKKAVVGPNSLEKACFSYVGKQKQLLELVKTFSEDRLLVINYETLIAQPEKAVSLLFDFVGVDYSDEYAKLVNSSGGRNKIIRNKAFIEDICLETYEQVKNLAKI